MNELIRKDLVQHRVKYVQKNSYKDDVNKFLIEDEECNEVLDVGELILDLNEKIEKRDD
jgi:hypothetical protein